MSHTAYKKYFWLVQYAAGYHPGQVAPPRTDGASLAAKWSNLKCVDIQPQFSCMHLPVSGHRPLFT